LLTEWRDYRDLDPTTTATWVTHPRILDARNALNPHTWRTAGWTYKGIGRP
ncbi:MAG: UDP-glucose 6-dehydrogenase, partial [Actinomycetota bacterium]